jgi:hypothetical protein
VSAQPDAALVATYAAARYEVYGDHPDVLMVTDMAGAHDEWLDDNNAATAVIITAWNPFSHQLSSAKNEKANHHLLQAIERRSLRWAPARSAAAGGGWSEDGYCVFDVPDAMVEHWLITYQQNAAVRVRKGERVELVWHMRFDSY